MRERDRQTNSQREKDRKRERATRRYRERAGWQDGKRMRK